MSTGISLKTPGNVRALIAAAALVLVAPAHAENLDQALVRAFHSNAELAAARDQLAAVREKTRQAESGYLPHVQLEASAGSTRLTGESSVFPFQDTTLNQRSIGLDVVQPLYRGGRTGAALDAATAATAAQEAELNATEQQIMLAAIKAYMSVYENQAVVRLNAHNVKVLSEQLQAAEASFKAGEATHTDVDQARARLAGARARLIHARGELESARAGYARVMGAPPSGDLEPPPAVSGLPATLAEAEKRAMTNFPVIAARYAEQAAGRRVDETRGELLPQVQLAARVQHAQEPDFVFSTQNTKSVLLQVSVPLYEGGSLRSRVREARHEMNRQHAQVISAERGARETVNRAWQAYTTTQAQARAIQAQIDAARSAFDGVRAEQRVGERTLLDVLDAEQELLNAQVDQVSSRHDEVVAAYSLKAAVGELTAKALGLSVAGGARVNSEESNDAAGS